MLTQTLVDTVVHQGLAVAVLAALLLMTGEDDETEIDQIEIETLDEEEEGDHAALQRKETVVDDTIMITETAMREKETEREIEIGIGIETEER